MKGIDCDMVGSDGTAGAAGISTSGIGRPSSDIRRTVLVLFTDGATKAVVDATDARRIADESFIFLVEIS